MLGIGQRADLAQQGHAADPRCQVPGQPCSGPPTQGERDRGQHPLRVGRFRRDTPEPGARDTPSRKGLLRKQIRAKSLAGIIISGVEVPELRGPVRFLIAVSIVSATMYRNAAWGSVPCLSKSLGGE